MTEVRVHLAHDWLVGLRGGEWVLDRIARQFGPTTIYTLVNDGRSMTEAIDACRIVTSPLQRWPQAAGRLRRWYLPLMRWAVEQIPVEPCDLLISTSSAVIKGIRPPARVPHLCYCHAPARYVWDQTEEYANGTFGAVRTAGLRAVRGRFREWDRRTCGRVTRFLANSAHTARRIKRFYDRDASVVYPPVRTSFFTPDTSVTREDWYLVVSALEPYKRVDLAMEAARAAGVRLKVAGTGSLDGEFQAQESDGIEMLGRVSDDELRALYRRARAMIHPQREDFGIAAVEAQACGCPVIAFKEGGAAETVTDETGVFFFEQSTEAIADAIERFSRRVFGSSTVRENALRFDERTFDNEIRQHAEELLQRAIRAPAAVVSEAGV